MIDRGIKRYCLSCGYKWEETGRLPPRRAGIARGTARAGEERGRGKPLSEEERVERHREKGKEEASVETVSAERHLVADMCDLLTFRVSREDLAKYEVSDVLASALYSAKSTLPAGSPRRVFIQDLAAALNRRKLLPSEHYDRFCELGYKYME